MVAPGTPGWVISPLNPLSPTFIGGKHGGSGSIRRCTQAEGLETCLVLTGFLYAGLGAMFLLKKIRI